MAEVRRALTWLLALPLIVVGSQVAHGLAYWWAYPFADVRLAILEHTGHGYLAYLPILIAFLGGLELLVLLVMVVDRCRGNVGHCGGHQRHDDREPDVFPPTGPVPRRFVMGRNHLIRVT